MNPQHKTHSRRQLPENFSCGDRLRIGLFVEGTVIRSEQKSDGDWLISLELGHVESRTTESARNRADHKSAACVRPVLWSVTGAGDVEFVLDIGVRQRLLTLGVSEKQKQLLRKNLATLPAAEAAELLREISGAQASPKQPEETADDGNEQEVQGE